ncbi:MAG: hypothetical protein A3B25_00805 [Candidatus Ryanbacteria bacterium RIFCSPLOWO2_01_FULL_48_26]|uniref:DUF4115 domain-containing protein n=1 Tax=Candidatus Ryanbacteria bacterium RIFCSPLOWO2_01_FULL_48_26 TaxID=1802126 RepID=A0A1G2GRG4_9BACT|nr:MAG: hypothetical protein A3B25_00805 [Candidatus Ryanbacteria bacterium RIFCSPLOWO2_01_FULL_48_26]
MEIQYFGQFLEERLKEKSIDIKKLSEISGISFKHLEALKNDDFLSLPSAPYVHGYINKLGILFGFKHDEWWQRIKISEFNKAARADVPPENRFAKRSLPRGSVTAMIAVVIACSAFYVGSPRIFGKPTITIRYPDQNPAVTTNKNITLEGSVTQGSKVYVNNELVEITSDGVWEKTIALGSGMNPVEIKAKKFLGGETKILQQILYEATPNTSFNANPPMSGI